MSLKTFSLIHGFLIPSTVIPASFSRKTVRMSRAGFTFLGFGSLGVADFTRGLRIFLAGTTAGVASTMGCSSDRVFPSIRTNTQIVVGRERIELSSQAFQAS